MTLWTPPDTLYQTPTEEGTIKDIFLSAVEGDNDAILKSLGIGVGINAVGNPSNGWGPFGKLPGFQGTPLHYAVGYGNLRTVKLLLERGARTDIKTRSGYYAREYAEKRGYSDIIELLDSYSERNNTPEGRPILDEDPYLTEAPIVTQTHELENLTGRPSSTTVSSVPSAAVTEMTQQTQQQPQEQTSSTSQDEHAQGQEQQQQQPDQQQEQKQETLATEEAQVDSTQQGGEGGQELSQADEKEDSTQPEGGGNSDNSGDKEEEPNTEQTNTEQAEPDSNVTPTTESNEKEEEENEKEEEEEVRVEEDEDEGDY